MSTRRGAPEPVPPHVLREYALLADGERGALVGPRGDIVWMCAPRWHSPAIFSALIGGRGCFSLTPAETFVWGGSYLDGSLVWRGRWATHTGIIETREALAYPGDEHRLVLLRQVRALDESARVRCWLEPRANYDTTAMRELHKRAGVWTARVGQLYLRLSGLATARPRLNGTALAAELEIGRGEQHDIVLEVSDKPLPAEAVLAGQAWEATTRTWARGVPTLDGALHPRDTRHSYAVIRGLMSRSGGLVAAATTSLPERAEEGRNYDYRYVWIRDLCFAGQAIAVAGPDELLDQAVGFVTERLLDDGDQMAPGYTTTGERIPKERKLRLPGYPGGYDIVGNWVNGQFQLDAFGEALQLLAAAARHDRLERHHWDAARAAAGAIERRWREPDAGIWELDNHAWTHSRLAAAAGLYAIASGDGVRRQAPRWLSLADRIVADTAAHATHPDGRWQRAPDDPRVDAALLLAGLRGATAPDDPRATATLAACLDELTVDGYAYRFRHDERPLAEAEGSFLLCGFLLALAHHQRGDAVEARGWYDTTRAAAGPPQLYSEEFDADQHQLRGNLPQAFVHALHLETALRLADTLPATIGSGAR